MDGGRIGVNSLAFYRKRKLDRLRANARGVVRGRKQSSIYIKGVSTDTPYFYALASAKLGSIPDRGKLYFGGSLCSIHLCNNS